MNLRALSLGILRDWDPDTAYAETLIERKCARRECSPQNRAFINHLVLGVVRNLSLLDLWIDHLAKGKLEDKARWILGMGLYELREMRSAPHAVVNETVALASRERSLVNAVLRRAQRESAKLDELARSADLATRYSLPPFLCDAWVARFGKEDTEALCRWHQSPAPTILRANKLKPNALESLTAHVGLKPAPGHDGFFICDGAPPVDLLSDGICYAQDPSTAMACHMLDPQPGETVLDACAAPGGKSALLCQLMGNTGSVIASDSAKERLETLTGNLDKLGATIAVPELHDWSQPAMERESAFDRILLDVPCSNTGVLRRRVDARWRLSQYSLAKHAKEQLAILSAASSALKPGGTLVYSTCSIEPEENEEVVKKFLEETPGFELETERTLLPFRDAIDGAYAARLRRK